MEQPILSHMPPNREAGSSIGSLPLAVAVTAFAQQAWHGQRGGIRMTAALSRKQKPSMQYRRSPTDKAQSIPMESS